MTELHPDVRDRAVQAAQETFYDGTKMAHNSWIRVVDAVAEVLAADLAEEIKFLRAERELYRTEGLKIQADRDVLKARVAELEGALRLTSALVGDGEDARNALKIVSSAEGDALKARVDLLTAALVDATGGLEYMRSYVPDSFFRNWQGDAYINRARTVLNEGEAS